MQDSALIRTLQLLTREEIDTLALFVESPIFNEVNRFNDTVRLFEYVREFYPEFRDVRLDKDTVGQALYPKRSNPANEVERSMAQLMHIVRQFINFRYSAVKGGRAVRGGRKNNLINDPVALLNFARQQLALMRFYRERVPVNTDPEPASTRPQPGASKKRRVKRAENFFQHLYQELEEVLNAQGQFNHFEEYEFSDFFYYRFLSEQEKTLYESIHEWSAQSGFVSLLATSEKLDRFFLLAKLDQICKLLHLQQIFTPFEADSDEYRRLTTNQRVTVKLVKQLSKNNYESNDPSIALYFTLLRLLSKKKVERTDAIADDFFYMLQQHQFHLPVKRIRDFHVMLRSYWARRYRQTRDRQFLEKQHHSHRADVVQLEKNQEKVQSSHFQNILFNAIKLGHLGWAESFLARFGREIIGTADPNMVADIGFAMLRFAQKRFNDAASQLPHYISYGALDDVNLYLLAATLDMRVRYESGILFDEESVNMKRATHKRIKENKTLRPQRKDGVLPFYEYTVNLFRLQEKIQLRSHNCGILRTELEKIRKAMAERPAVDSEWLQEKLQEISMLLEQKCPKTESK